MDKRYKILLIDDDEFLVRMYQLVWMKAGMEVVTRPNAEGDFSGLVLDEKPDVVVCDVILGEGNKDGFQALHELRADKRTSSTPFIFLTNQSHESDRERGRKEGANGYIIMADTTPTAALSEVVRLLETASPH